QGQAAGIYSQQANLRQAEAQRRGCRFQRAALDLLSGGMDGLGDCRSAQRGPADAVYILSDYERLAGRLAEKSFDEALVAQQGVKARRLALLDHLDAGDLTGRVYTNQQVDGT